MQCWPWVLTHKNRRTHATSGADLTRFLSISPFNPQVPYYEVPDQILINNHALLTFGYQVSSTGMQMNMQVLDMAYAACDAMALALNAAPYTSVESWG